METKEIRQIRHRRPAFIRQDATYRNRVADPKWRKPRGRHSKMRLEQRGKRAIAKIGYGSPNSIKNLHASGMPMVRVENLEQLSKVTTKQIIILSRTLSKRKRLEVLKQAKQKGLKFVNVQNTDNAISEIENGLKVRKEVKAKRKQEKLKSEQKQPEKKESKSAKKTEVKKEENKA